MTVDVIHIDIFRCEYTHSYDVTFLMSKHPTRSVGRSRLVNFAKLVNQPQYVHTCKYRTQKLRKSIKIYICLFVNPTLDPEASLLRCTTTHLGTAADHRSTDTASQFTWMTTCRPTTTGITTPGGHQGANVINIRKKRFTAILSVFLLNEKIYYRCS